MTLNPEYLHTTPAEINTQIASYFDIVDRSVLMSDTNKRYTINPQSSYSPSAPISARSYTTVIISPNSDNTADLYNGFITAKMEVSVELQGLPELDKFNEPKLKLNDHTYDCNKIWFGFKDAMDAIDRYEILANGITIYTQSCAPEESFITACSENDVVKKTDIYSKARHKDIWNHKEGARCGGILNITRKDLTNKDENKQPVPLLGNKCTTTIPLKIDIRRFLPLSGIKYLPAFAGKIELRLYFKTDAMVWCPMGLPPALKAFPKDLALANVPEITCEFVPIGEEATIWSHTNVQENSGDPTTLLTSECTLHVENDYKITSCYSIIPCFGIESNIYNALLMRYSQQVLTFPIQTLLVQTMSKQIKTPSTATTATITPRFVDSIFLLFPQKANYRTVFKNPNFEVCQLRCGGYGSVPNVPFSTSNEDSAHADPCFIEYCQNSMNVNGGGTGFSKSVAQSLTCSNGNSIKPNKGRESKDTTNFFIGFPTETDNTFQQGQTSQTPINYELIVQGKGGPNSYIALNDIAPRIVYLVDSTLNIQVQPNGMPPIVDISAYDITSPVSN